MRIRIRAVIAVVGVIVVAGCGSTPTGSPPPASRAVSTGVFGPDPVATSATPTATVRATPAPSSRAPVAAQALPAGKVPPEVVGQWSGGAGDRTGEYLIVAADGSYARGRNAETSPYRRGVIVADGIRFVAYDLDGRSEAGTWEYTNAAGIEVLGVYFGGDYYSYARA